MKNIKLKFWLGHSEKMLGEYTLKECLSLNWDLTDDVIPLQFTGVLDKNGKEIYEGDILTCNEYPFLDDDLPNYHAVIEWVFTSWQIVLVCVNKNKRGVSDGVNESFEYEEGQKCEYEVIGNIYENPELLEK